MGRDEERTAWPGLQLLKGALDEATCSFEPLKATFREFASCFENEASARKDYEKLKAVLDSLMHDLSKYLGSGAHSSMVPVVTTLARGIELELERVKSRLKRKGMRRYVETNKDVDEVVESYRQIKALFEQFKLNANLVMWETVDEQTMEMRLKNLPYSQAARYDSVESENLRRTACTPNTRTDVLRQIQAWSHNVASRKVYWLNGMAGTGKTTITFSLCEYLEQNGMLAANFFCSRQLPTCRDALASLLKDNPEAYNQPPGKQFEKLVATPLRKMGYTLSSDFIVVIDALDECQGDGVDCVLNTLLAEVSGLPIKFFVASRPDPKITDCMRSEHAQHVRQELQLHELERSIVLQDITTYLWAKLGSLNLPSEDINRLAEQSGVLFIYASTVVRYIGHDNFSRSSRRLKQVLDRVDTPRMNCHQEIDILYTTILQAALDGGALDDSELEEIRLVLYTVLCAQEPLTANIVAALLGFDLDSVLAALRPLFSILQLSHSSGLITTLHESFPNYMFDRARSGTFYCDAGEENTRLAQNCFRLIKIPNPPFNICGLKTSYQRDRAAPDFEDRVKSAIKDELFYACRHFGAHLELARRPTDLFNDLYSFLSVRLLLWMEILNLKERIYEGVGVLYSLQALLQGIECPHNIGHLARDAWKFVAAFSSSPMVKSTPHIYLSALPFWPEHRPVSTHYLPVMRGLVKPIGAALRKREAAPLAVVPVGNRVTCMACSPANSNVVCGYWDGAIRIWNVHTGQSIDALSRNCTGPIQSLAYSTNGARIVAATGRGFLVWDAYTGQSIGSLETYTKQSSSGETTETSSAGVCMVAYLAGGTHILSVFEDESIQIVSGTIEKDIQSHDPCTLRIRSTLNGQVIGLLFQGQSYFTSVSYSPDGSKILFGDTYGLIRVWGANNSQIIGRLLTGHTGEISSVAYSPNGENIVSSSLDGTVRIWDVATHEMVGQPLEHFKPRPAYSPHNVTAAYSPDGSYIIAALNATLYTWDSYIKPGVQKPIEGHTSCITGIAWSPDGAHIASSSRNQLYIWDSQTGFMTKKLPLMRMSEVILVAYSPDGAEIVAASRSCYKAEAASESAYCYRLHVCDARTEQSVGELPEGHTHVIKLLTYSPNGEHIISASEDCICIWHAQTKRMTRLPINISEGWISSFAYSSDKDYVALSTNYDSSSAGRLARSQICIWDLQIRVLTHPFDGHTSSINSLTVSPGGAYIASGSSDRAIRIWDVKSRSVIGEPLIGHTDEVTIVAYSPDGTRIASGSKDQMICIWDTSTGQLIARPLDGHTGEISTIAFSPDARHIASGSSDCTIRVWNLEYDRATSPCFRPAGSVDEEKARNWALDRWSRWVTNSDSMPLLWVPPDVRDVLLRPQNTAVMSRHGSLQLDFSNARLGERWWKCYNPGSLQDHIEMGL